MFPLEHPFLFDWNFIFHDFLVENSLNPDFSWLFDRTDFFPDWRMLILTFPDFSWPVAALIIELRVLASSGFTAAVPTTLGKQKSPDFSPVSLVGIHIVDEPQGEPFHFPQKANYSSKFDYICLLKIITND